MTESEANRTFAEWVTGQLDHAQGDTRSEFVRWLTEQAAQPER